MTINLSSFFFLLMLFYNSTAKNTRFQGKRDVWLAHATRLKSGDLTASMGFKIMTTNKRLRLLTGNNTYF